MTIAIPFIFFALIILGVVGQLLYTARDRKWFAEHGVSVGGQIIEVKERRSTSMSPTGPDGAQMMSTSRRYEPTVRFQTQDGQMIETRTPTRNRRPGRAGDFVQVAYDPANPKRARIVS